MITKPSGGGPRRRGCSSGVLAHHLGRQQQMARGDRRDLAAGARLRLDRVPPEVLAASLPLAAAPSGRSCSLPLVRGRVAAGRRVKQLIIASTFYQCLSLAAALDAGVLPDADERILVLANSSQAPELSSRPAGSAGLRRRAPPASTGWWTSPRCSIPGDRCSSRRAVSSCVTWQRLLRSHWDLGDAPVQIFMDSVQVNPGPRTGRDLRRRRAVRALRRSDDVLPDPQGSAAPSQPAADRVWCCVDLVPGLVPRLLAEERHRSPGRFRAIRFDS